MFGRHAPPACVKIWKGHGGRQLVATREKAKVLPKPVLPSLVGKIEIAQILEFKISDEYAIIEVQPVLTYNLALKAVITAL